jgi:hypothetical protein
VLFGRCGKVGAAGYAIRENKTKWSIPVRICSYHIKAKEKNVRNETNVSI